MRRFVVIAGALAFASMIAVALLLPPARPVSQDRESDLVELVWSVVGAKSVHFSGWYISPHSNRKTALEGWVKDGSKLVLLEQDGTKSIYDGEKLVEVHTSGGFRHTTIRLKRSLFTMRQGVTYLQILVPSGLLDDSIREDAIHPASCQQVTLAGGRVANVVRLDETLSTIVLVYDPDTRLPISWEEYDYDGRLVGVVDRFEYNVRVPASAFDMSLVQTAGAIDLRSLNAARRTSHAVRKRVESSTKARVVLDMPPGACGRAAGGEGLAFESMGCRGLTVFQLRGTDVYRVVGKALIRGVDGNSYWQVVEDEDVRLPSAVRGWRVAMLDKKTRSSED